MLAKHLFVVRHAHRKVVDASSDNSLSKKGLKQVEALGQTLLPRLRNLESPYHFFTSPKKRCVETVQPLSEQINSRFAIEPKLDEQSFDETTEDFKNRLADFLEELMQTGPTAIICGHGDNLPILVEQITGITVNLEKSGWVELSREENVWKIDELRLSANL